MTRGEAIDLFIAATPPVYEGERRLVSAVRTGTFCDLRPSVDELFRAIEIGGATRAELDALEAAHLAAKDERPGPPRLWSLQQSFGRYGYPRPLPDQLRDENTVRAKFLSELLIAHTRSPLLDRNELGVVGACIVGDDGAEMRLQNQHGLPTLLLYYCRCHCAVIIRDSEISVLALHGSYVAGIDADRCAVRGSVHLDDGFECVGVVRMRGAIVGSTLSIHRSRLHFAEPSNEPQNLVELDGAKIGGELILASDFGGSLKLERVEVGGNFDMSTAVIRSSRLFAVSAQNMSVSGDAIIGSRPYHFGDRSDQSFVFKADAPIDFRGSETKGPFSIIDCYLFDSQGHARRSSRSSEVDAGGLVLNLDHVIIGGDLVIGSGTHIVGQVRIESAQVSGNLSCYGANLSIVLGERSRALSSWEQRALLVSQTSVGQSILIGKHVPFGQFRSVGEVRIDGCKVEGRIDCAGGSFENLFLEKPPRSRNNIVSHVWRAMRSVWHKPYVGPALSITHCQIGSDLQFLYKDSVYHTEFNGSVDLSGTKCWGWNDSIRCYPLQRRVSRIGDPSRPFRSYDSTWCRPYFVFDDFTFDRLSNRDALSASQRATILRLQRRSHLRKAFRPQPYNEVAKALRSQGHEDDAQAILIRKGWRYLFGRLLAMFDGLGQNAKERPFRSLLDLIARLIKFAAYAGAGLFIGLLARFGYGTARLLAVGAAVWIGCAIYYQAATSVPGFEAFAPSNPEIYLHSELQRACARNWVSCVSDNEYRKRNGVVFAELPSFSPLIYSLDVMLPGFDLGQKKDWGPVDIGIIDVVAPKFRPRKIVDFVLKVGTTGYPKPVGTLIWQKRPRRLNSAWLDWMRWGQGIIGPVLLALLAVTFTGVLRREN